MANRNFPSAGKIYSFNVMPVMINCQVQIGASGAVTSFVGKGIQSIARTATGKYTIVLQDNYNTLLALWPSMQVASSTSGIDAVEIVGVMTNSANPSIAGASINIQTLNPAGTAADPVSGAQMNLVILLNNSSVQ